MEISKNHFFPQIHYFDSDFVSLYEQTWARIENLWVPHNNDKHIPSGYVNSSPEHDEFHIQDAISSSFFLLYSNGTFNPTHALDFFYHKQEENGAIRPIYSKSTGEPLYQNISEDMIAPPYLLWAEYNYYNRTDNKKRLKEILPKIDLFLHWIAKHYQDKDGLFVVPHETTNTQNLPRGNAKYFIDFNVQMVLAYHFMIKLSMAANFRNQIFKYTKAYYNLKALINDNFWCQEDGFYYDLDESKNFVKIKSINCFWTLLAQIPNNEQVFALNKILSDSEEFNTITPFPTLSKSSSEYSRLGMGYRGSVYAFLTYMIIKGLAVYGYHEFARDSAIKHLSSVLANFYSDPEHTGDFWEAYQPEDFLPSTSSNNTDTSRKNFFSSTAVATISLVVENIIGFDICLPKKMVYWTLPHLEFMGIENLQLKRNIISTMLQQTNRGWEIRHSAEKLYYFSVDIQEKQKRKTLPIPSGKCSLLVDKL